VSGPAPAPDLPAASLLPELDALAAEAMEEWKIPGLALAVVQPGEAPLLKAYGQRDVEAGLPVTTETQFNICSITKSFTSTGLALLMDEGRLDWAKPVRDYLPEFRLQDAVATDRVTVRDLLCHHSGLPRHDWVWMPADLSRMQMMAAMRHLESSRDVRDTWQYSNLAYNVAGLVTERISGQSWEDFISSRLTGKLDMTVSFAPEDLAAAPDGAVPYVMDGNTRLRTQLWPIRTTAAGGINAPIGGLARWMEFHLGGGTSEGRPMLAPALIRQLQAPRVHSGSSDFAEFGDTHYGLGFHTYSYRGERVVGHSGGWIGWSTLMSMMPGRGLGVAVLTNRAPHPVTQILTYHMFDRLSGKQPVPWLGRFRELRQKFLAQQEVDRQTREAVRRADTRPSHALADYAGDYEHPAYGRMAITLEGDRLQWTFRGLATAPLAHRHYDTFELPEIPDRLHPDRLVLSFAMDREGNIASLSAPLEPMVKDIVFTRVAAGEGMDATFRRACAGRYSHGHMIHAVALDAEGQLLLSPANQPTYRLRPYQGRIFRIVELEGFRVEFRSGPDGTVDALFFHQPNGTFLARRMEA
jgi:CubicO group peptidase (beta-lactamase class C family)